MLREHCSPLHRDRGEADSVISILLNGEGETHVFLHTTRVFKVIAPLFDVIQGRRFMHFAGLDDGGEGAWGERGQIWLVALLHVNAK